MSWSDDPDLEFEYVHSPIGEDRISSLPETVLIHLLSFLPITKAIKTSRLARRWRYLWRSVHTLNFNLQKIEKALFPRKDVEFYCRIYKKRGKNRYQLMETLMTGKVIRLIDRVLLVHSGSGLQKFHLSCSEHKVHLINDLIDRTNIWIQAAISRRVQEFNIVLQFGIAIRLPPCLFLSESLEVLHLTLDEDLKLPSVMNFPRLRTLHLNSLVFCDEHLAAQLFSSCPVLENLVIMGCGNDKDFNVFEICSPSLRHLVIEHSHGDLRMCTVKVVAPRLESFKHQGCIVKGYILEQLSSLTEASIECNSRLGRNEYHAEPIRNVLDGLSVAKTLKICMSCTKVLSETFVSSDCMSTPFHQLRHLELGMDLKVERLQLILSLINMNPTLHTLVINLYWRSNTFKKEELLLSEEFMGTLRSSSNEHKVDNLKKVEIRQVIGEVEVELQLMKYLLETQMLLEKMMIQLICKDQHLKEKIVKELLGLPRASPRLSLLVK